MPSGTEFGIVCDNELKYIPHHGVFISTRQQIDTRLGALSLHVLHELHGKQNQYWSFPLRSASGVYMCISPGDFNPSNCRRCSLAFSRHCQGRSWFGS